MGCRIDNRFRITEKHQKDPDDKTQTLGPLIPLSIRSRSARATATADSIMTGILRAIQASWRPLIVRTPISPFLKSNVFCSTPVEEVGLTAP
jgi:hypothetical protein